jgi:diaminohydroxyphosphoribosylaminopyrimidine deaminase / 5-amino-6-(5-phosphoribosylamino)uracil reductase
MPLVSPDVWKALLARAPADTACSALYDPLLAPATAPDGCFVLGRIAQSLDGRIATASGESRWISGEADLEHTHRLRALSDAVLVGASTVRADDPQLTTRAVEGPSPVRVILDPARRLDERYRVFGEGPPTLLACAAGILGPERLGQAEVLPIAMGGGESTSVPCWSRWPGADCGGSSSRAVARRCRGFWSPESSTVCT